MPVIRDGGAGGSGTLIGRFLVVCLCSAVCDPSRHGGRALGGSGGLLGGRVEPEDRPGGGTGGAFTGGLTVDVDVGVGACLRETGAAL